ncbi:hypothetical protein KAR91_76270 [Candidatus Pacearchaeota archaeon]|nr:hypothetical protein [Candidatus Pacearchaeota archaeon]
MPEFTQFKNAVQQQFEDLSKRDLFRTGASKDELWETYLSSFPEGTDLMFRERTEHDCQCCRQFIRACGNAVAVIDNKLVSIWDIKVEGFYQVVADALSALVKSYPIENIFLHYELNLGTNYNIDNYNKDIIWHHFYFRLPREFVEPGADIGTMLSNSRSGHDVFKRGLFEISVTAINTVLELIEQKSIYRGEEFKRTVKLFLKLKEAFGLVPVGEEDNFCWKNLPEPATRVRNTAIGTLLTDISEGVDLDEAVRLFESKVAPENYKRPTAVITKAMIANAQEKVAELRIEDSLSRRYAVVDDVTINNVLFANRDTKKAMNVFDEMAVEAPVNIKNLEKVDEVEIETFIADILPKADSIELMVENSHANNFMSLIAPQDLDAKPIFKWPNNFSWAYNGEVADSIKERVKKAGGNVNGILRCSLSWFNTDDLDIHVLEPDGNHMHYGRKHNARTSGKLDVDMNVSKTVRNPVENVVWTNKAKMEEGRYKVYVHNYTKRESVDVGFDVEIEYDGVIHSFHYAKVIACKVTVAEFDFTRKDGIKFIKSLPVTHASREVWGIPTHTFHKVSMVMNSPNHWDGHKTGNKHYFFILEGCHNDDTARGFFNEFLNENLNEHRKVFEVLGSKLKVAQSDPQLSGLGFSSTQKNHVFCKVTGAFTRTIKINF